MNPVQALRPLLACAALLAAGSSHAAIEVFTDEAAFLAALASHGTDSFDDLTPGVGVEGPLARSAGGVGYSVSASPNSPILYGAGTADDAWLSTNNEADSITFGGFSQAVAGIGAYFFGSDADGLPFANGFTVVRVTAAGDEAEVAFARAATPGTYFGFLSSTPIVSLEVRTVARRRQDTWPTVNDLTLAAVPEPGAWALMALGLATVGFISRRRPAA